MPIPKVIFMHGYPGHEDELHDYVNETVQDLIECKHPVYVCDVPGSIKLDYKLSRDMDGETVIIAAIFFSGRKRKNEQLNS